MNNIKLKDGNGSSNCLFSSSYTVLKLMGTPLFYRNFYAKYSNKNSTKGYVSRRKDNVSATYKV